MFYLFMTEAMEILMKLQTFTSVSKQQVAADYQLFISCINLQVIKVSLS